MLMVARALQTARAKINIFTIQKALAVWVGAHEYIEAKPPRLAFCVLLRDSLL